VISVNGGQIEWGEQRLVLKKDGQVKCGNVNAEWQPHPALYFIAINGGQLVPTSQMLNDVDSDTSGFILRRIDIVNPGCSSKSSERTNVQALETFIVDVKHESGSNFLEFFKPNASRCIPPSPEQHVWMRIGASSCGENVGTGFVVGGTFRKEYEYGLYCAMRDAQGLGASQ